MVSDIFSTVVEQATTYWFLYVPLGWIGIYRWTVWALVEFGGLFYKPKSSNYKGKVTIVTPVYNEDPDTFKKALESWSKNKVDEIIAVIDYTDKPCIKIFREFRKKYKNGNLIITKTPGKRPALVDGIKVAKHEIVALVDSDVTWEKNAKKNGVAPFANAEIGGVAVRANVSNPKTPAQRIFNMLLNLRYLTYYPFLSSSGDYLRCLSGRTAFYRKKALQPVLDDLINEKFMGEPSISGDDKALTYLIQGNGWKTYFQRNSQVYTTAEEKFSDFNKQKIRWTRNSWRADLKVMTKPWVWKHPVFALGYLDTLIQTFTILLAPTFFIISVVLGLWSNALILVVWWHLSRSVKISRHLIRHPKDIVLLPVYVIFTFYMAVVRVYALVTVKKQGWITRWDKDRLIDLSFIQRSFAHITTFLIIGFIIFATYTNRVNALNSRQQVYDISKDINMAELDPRNLAFAASSYGANSDQWELDLLPIKRHVVKQGDSLSSLSREYNVSVEKILVANTSILPNWNRIVEGMVLSIPHPNVELGVRKNYQYQVIRPAVKSIHHDPQTDTIIVTGRGTITSLEEIYNAVGNEQIERLNDKEWLLKANLYLKNGITMSISKDTVSWLKLQSNETGFVNIIAQDSRLTFDGVKVTSWDDKNNDYDHNWMDGRAYILAKSDARLDIYNSEAAYLGYKTTPILEGGTYGVSWRIPDDALGYDLVSGEIINSKFHNNYFGVYSFGGFGMLFRGNEFYNNVEYGFDPHDDSSYFLVEDNISHNNGSHGFIFSKRCKFNTVRNNLSYSNNGHGFMLHEDSNYNVLQNNTSYENVDGIALYQSNYNTLQNNKIYKNTRGIRISQNSAQNLLVNNSVSENEKQGIYLYSGSDSNSLVGNSIATNDVGLYIKTRSNNFDKNLVTDNITAVKLSGASEKNVFMSNSITDNKKYAFIHDTQEDVINYAYNNSFD